MPTVLSKRVKLKGVAPISDDVDLAIRAFLDHGRAKDLSERTIEFYDHNLTAFRRYLNEVAPDVAPKDMTPELIRDFVVRRRAVTSATTANHHVNVLRNFFGFLVRQGFLTSNPALLVDKMKERQRIIKTFEPDQLQGMLSTCGRDFYGLRDRAIILILLDTGLRVGELVTMRLEDVSWSEQVMKVLGKGNKEREVPFGIGVRKALNAYLASRKDAAGDSLVFVTHYGEPLERARVRDLLVRRAKRARVSGVRVSCHTFRHTFAKQWLLNGGDAFSLQRILGHTTMDMVRNYVNMAQDEVKTLHRRFSPVDCMKPVETTGRKRIR